MAQDVQQQRSQQPTSSRGGCKLFLGGLSWETSEDVERVLNYTSCDTDKLRQYFSKYGEITEVVVMRDRTTNKPRGFGFITFADDTVANKVCQETHTIDGRTIDAKPSVPQGEGSRPRTRKVFVELFQAHFEQFGKVVEAQIMQDYTSGRSRGFGFVTFDDEAAVEKVFAAGTMQELGGKRVEVKNATPKGSGPQSVRMAGRGGFGPAMNAGRGAPGGRGYGEYGQMPQYGMYGMPGYGMVPEYGGYGMPYGAYGGMVMPPQMGYGGYGAYPPNPYGYQGQPGGAPGYAQQAPVQPGGVAGETPAGSSRYSGQPAQQAQQQAPQRQQQQSGSSSGPPGTSQRPPHR